MPEASTSERSTSETSAVPEGSSLLSPAPTGPQELLAQMEQMQQMLAALNADLRQLDADLQAPPQRTAAP
jgi:hypothetical protein